jgi:UDP-N-acetyl-2-amino-2-deoxyglucuronate dehydrogenase
MAAGRPLRVGLVGAGNIATHHLPAYLQHPEALELVAICDLNEELAAARALEAGVAHVFADVRATLRGVEIDALDVCTIPDQHLDVALAGIEAGKHVLIEKPFATSLDDCRTLLAAAESAGVTLMVAQNQRYLPPYRAAKRVLDSGELGPIRAVRFESLQCWPAVMPDGHWSYNARRAGGGAVISVAIHRIDLMRYLVGDVVSVSAVCRTTRPEFVNGAEDYATATLEFANGALGEMFTTVSAFRMPWSETFMIFGDDGTMHAVPPPGNIRGPAVVASTKRTAPAEVWTDQVSGFEPLDASREGLASESGQVNELLHFAACCETGAEPLTSGRDNLETMKIVFGIYESALTGEPVTLSSL